MISNKFFVWFSFILLISLQSCVSMGPHFDCVYKGERFETTSIYRPFVGMSEYKGGYWGTWYCASELRYIVDETWYGFTITYYKKYSHPSDFEFKIVAKKYTGLNEKMWQTYQGEFIVKREREESVSKYYDTPRQGISSLMDTWSFPCTIKRIESKLPEDKYIYPQLPSALKYTINVFYNGVGRGFCIDGKWIHADEYDYW